MSKRFAFYGDQVVDRDHATGRLLVDHEGNMRLVRARDVFWLERNTVTAAISEHASSDGATKFSDERLDTGAQTALMPYEAPEPQRATLHLVSSLSAIALESTVGMQRPALHVVEGGRA